MGLSWAVLGLSWGPLGPSWSGLGSLLGSLGASESRNSEKAKNIEKTNENQRFWPLGPLLGGIFKPLGASWEASWAVKNASWAAGDTWRRSWERLETVWGRRDGCLRAPGAFLWLSWAVLGGSGGSLGALLGRLGALLGVCWAVLGRSRWPLGPSWSGGSWKTRECKKPRENQ